ncbi:AAA family ATPase [Candidatus Saccharibacteria bacterium]|nr:MAG: AAA family ATPase [Candidatus Saccharibacteria bacterium]
MNQGLALEILLAGESALLTGPAGTGKTYVLNQFIRLSKYEGKHVSVTATTGLAATHLGEQRYMPGRGSVSTIVYRMVLSIILVRVDEIL